LASSNCITLRVRVSGDHTAAQTRRRSAAHAPADVGQHHVRGAHAGGSKAFEAESCAEQQRALAEHPVRFVDEQLRQPQR
jgi:hypothetical protein